MDLVEECTLLGASLLGAQKLEFALYGIVSHLSHAYEGKKDKRFTELTPEEFLRGTVDDLKLTLGQLENAFADKGTDQIMGIRVPVDIVPQQLSKAKLCLYFYRF